MLRQFVVRTARPALSTRLAFSTSSRIMAGETGGIRSTGSSDAFTKREKASEDMEIRKREMEKLAELRAKVKDQHDALKKLQESIDELAKEQGGELK